jgi:hypothetical protein
MELLPQESRKKMRRDGKGPSESSTMPGSLPEGVARLLQAAQNDIQEGSSEKQLILLQRDSLRLNRRHSNFFGLIGYYPLNTTSLTLSRRHRSHGIGDYDAEIEITRTSGMPL